MPEERIRPILPALPLASSSAGSTALSPQAKKEYASRTSTACEACKRRKSRCVGRPPPCQMCKTSGTECIIDATLDQRRKVSAKRLAEQSDIQRDLLTALLQYIQYAQPSDMFDLSRCFSSGEPGRATAQLLGHFANGLDPDQKISDNDLDDLLGAFASTVRGRSSPDKTDFSPSRRGYVVPVFPATHIKTESSPRDSAAPNQQRYHTPAQSLQRTYQRWFQYFENQGSRSDMNGNMESVYGWPNQSLDHIQGGGALRGQLRPQMSSSPGLSEPSDYFDPMDGRAYFHPVLHILPSEGDMTPMSATSSVGPAFPPQSTVLDGVGAPALRRRGSGESNYIEILRSFPSSFSPPPSIMVGSPQYPSELQLSRFAIHSVQPLSNQENSPLSRVILDYREAARKFIASGSPPMEVLGTEGICVDLLFRARTKDDESNVCNWASEIWRSFDDWDIFTRLAHILFYTYLMRWTLLPTSENYSSIPPNLKPTPLQCLTPHHAAIDFIPFPHLRDGLIRNFRDWMTAFPRAGLRLNWDDGGKGVDSAVVRDEITGKIKVRREFERWVFEEGFRCSANENNVHLNVIDGNLNGNNSNGNHHHHHVGNGTSSGVWRVGKSLLSVLPEMEMEIESGEVVFIDD